MQRRLMIYIWGFLFLLAAVRSTYAANTCQFSYAGDVMALAGDCTVDTTILVPNGFTFDGGNSTITVVDPKNGHFLGAVIKNDGALANVVNVRITSAGLSDTQCDANANALRGILFDNASGTIYGNTISSLNQGSSVCQEGNAIEVRNDWTNGNPTPPAVQTVEITSNRVAGFQKTGIVCDGYVSCLVRSNVVGPSAVQAKQPVNGIQIGYGAGALVENNDVAGNSWPGPPIDGKYYVSTAILLWYAANGTIVRHNNLMDGNADIGIYVVSDGAFLDNNRIYETGDDLNQGGFDFGVYVDSPSLGDAVTGTETITNNKVRGYLFAYNSLDLTTPVGGNNKANSSPAPK
jgi:hypothetical protein